MGTNPSVSPPRPTSRGDVTTPDFRWCALNSRIALAGCAGAKANSAAINSAVKVNRLNMDLSPDRTQKGHLPKEEPKSQLTTDHCPKRLQSSGNSPSRYSQSSPACPSPPRLPSDR